MMLNSFSGISSKAGINELVTLVNAFDRDAGVNASMELLITGSFLYKFGATKATGSIVPSPFSIDHEGKVKTAVYMGEYSQDHFRLEIIAKEVQPPERFAKTNVHVSFLGRDFHFCPEISLLKSYLQSM